VPHAPENLAVLEVTFNSVKLAWNSTGNTTSAPVKSYLVQYRANGSSDDYIERSLLKPEVSVGSLSADTVYEFHVFVVNDAGRSLSSASVVVTTSHAG